MKRLAYFVWTESRGGKLVEVVVREISGWVWPENVRTALEYLSRWVGYDFDDLDWQNIEQALSETSWEPPEHWYRYPITGTPALVVWFAREPSADPVGVRIRGDMGDILDARIDTLLTVLADLRPSTAT